MLCATIFTVKGSQPLHCAPVAQLAEATDSKPVQCEFESHQGHFSSQPSDREPPGRGLFFLVTKLESLRS